MPEYYWCAASAIMTSSRLVVEPRILPQFSLKTKLTNGEILLIPQHKLIVIKLENDTAPNQNNK
jgi:hypothetical protein